MIESQKVLLREREGGFVIKLAIKEIIEITNHISLLSKRCQMSPEGAEDERAPNK